MIVATRCILNKPCSEEKKGRPIDNEKIHAYDKVFNWLENDSDCDMYTLNELHEKMKTFSENCKVYTIKRVKQRLMETYTNNIYFTQSPEKENVICFRNMADKILSDFKKKKQQTKIDIITASAKLVKADIQEMDKNIEFYPTTA